MKKSLSFFFSIIAIALSTPASAQLIHVPTPRGMDGCAAGQACGGGGIQGNRGAAAMQTLEAFHRLGESIQNAVTPQQTYTPPSQTETPTENHDSPQQTSSPINDDENKLYEDPPVQCLSIKEKSGNLFNEIVTLEHSEQSENTAALSRLREQASISMAKFGKCVRSHGEYADAVVEAPHIPNGMKKCVKVNVSQEGSNPGISRFGDNMFASMTNACNVPIRAVYCWLDPKTKKCYDAMGQSNIIQPGSTSEEAGPRKDGVFNLHGFVCDMTDHDRLCVQKMPPGNHL